MRVRANGCPVPEGEATTSERIRRGRLGVMAVPCHPPPMPEEGGRRPPSISPPRRRGSSPGSARRCAWPRPSTPVRSRRRPCRRRPRFRVPQRPWKVSSSREYRSIGVTLKGGRGPGGVQAHARAVASLPSTYVLDSGACRRVSDAERGGTVGDLFLRTRAGCWRGAEAPPSNIRSASATPTCAGRRVRSGR
jgi:hypothetical protein